MFLALFLDIIGICLPMPRTTWNKNTMPILPETVFLLQQAFRSVLPVDLPSTFPVSNLSSPKCLPFQKNFVLNIPTKRRWISAQQKQENCTICYYLPNLYFFRILLICFPQISQGLHKLRHIWAITRNTIQIHSKF